MEQHPYNEWRAQQETLRTYTILSAINEMTPPAFLNPGEISELIRECQVNALKKFTATLNKPGPLVLLGP